MARGFLSGVIWGGVLSVGVAGVASVLAPPPKAPDVGDAAPGVAAPARVTDPGSGETGSDADGVLDTSASAPQSPAPDPDSLTELDADTLSTAAQPQTGQADNLAAPAPVPEAGGVALQGDDPVLPNPQALAPMAPQDTDDLSISTEPAQPPQPMAEPATGAFDSPTSPQAPEAAQPGPQPTDESAPQAPATGAAPKVADAPPAQPATPDQDEAQQPAPETADPPQPATPAPGASDTETQSAALSPAARPSVGTPAVSLLERDGGVSVNRPGADQDTGAGDTSGRRPIERFAQPFDASGGKPLMSIILIDDGTSSMSGATGLSALASFAHPLTFAIDSSLPDAADRAAVYRRAGFEVLAMVDLPQGAQPTDAETAFAATLATLPEVVGVLGASSGSLQSSRELSDQIAAILAQSGHGWVTQAKGLNTAATLARRAGVPAAPIFRDFDSKNQTAVVIRRFLDQAAFKAGQEDGVIMLGRLRPETIAALLLWGLQDRAGQVALAPISAVLLEGEN